MTKHLFALYFTASGLCDVETDTPDEFGPSDLTEEDYGLAATNASDEGLSLDDLEHLDLDCPACHPDGG